MGFHMKPLCLEDVFSQVMARFIQQFPILKYLYKMDPQKKQLDTATSMMRCDHQSWLNGAIFQWLYIYNFTFQWLWDKDHIGEICFNIFLEPSPTFADVHLL